MKYLCLTYDEAKKLDAMTANERDALMGEYFSFTEGIRANGKYVLLPLEEAILEEGKRAVYRLAHSARRELYGRLGRTADARASFAGAMVLARQEPER